MTALCPSSGTPGKTVKLVTVKALLSATALGRIDALANYYFCDSADCEIVYFSEDSSFSTRELNVRVYQKDSAADVLVCYCFGHTKGDLENDPNLESVIRDHTRANRCGCEVRNPQGSCCLGNVRAILTSQKLASKLNGTNHA